MLHIINYDKKNFDIIKIAKSILRKYIKYIINDRRNSQFLSASLKALLQSLIVVIVKARPPLTLLQMGIENSGLKESRL